MHLALSEPLSSLVRGKYEAAKTAGHLLFSPTQLSIIRSTSGVPFQLRYCPALAQKPLPSVPSPEPKKKINPFDPPSPKLLVVNIPTQSPSHVLILNKFPVINEHFIIATKLNKPQTNLLEQDDLDATYACLKQWQDEGAGDLFAFFNSGEHSGASQPHRHLQFLPVEQMLQGQDSGGWKVLINSLVNGLPAVDPESPTVHSDFPLPFIVFAVPLPPNPTPVQLSKLYMKLHGEATAAVESYIAKHPGELHLHSTEGGASPISYNLALTTSTMAICPRRSGGTMLRGNDGAEIGQIELNGTILGATLMVKGEPEWEALKANANMLDEVLAGIGIPRDVAAA